MLDVGQGLSALVRTARHALLYDAGPQFGPGADSGSRIIVPYLRAAGVRRLDGMIVTHDDDDHWGGAASVLQAVPVHWLLTSLPDLDPLVVQSERPWRCESGQRWEWDGVRFEVLHPARDSHEDPAVKENDRSCVLRVEAGGRRVLLPADIERRTEEALLAPRARDRLRADVLLAPHHGSRTSSSPGFRARDRSAESWCSPWATAIASVIPIATSCSGTADIGARIYRTDRDGALTIALRADGTISVTPYRAVYRRYWQTPMIGDPVPDPEEF